MNALQAWIVVGVPGVVLAAALFAGRSRVRALFGYAVLAALVVTFATTPGGGASAAVIGAIAMAMVALGRGTHADRDAVEHHQRRRRYTTTGG